MVYTFQCGQIEGEHVFYSKNLWRYAIIIAFNKHPEGIQLP